MRHPKTIFAALAGALLLGTTAAQTAPREAPSRVARSVAYVGDLGSARGKAYARFLEGAFAELRALDVASLEPAALRDVDVVLLDWEPKAKDQPRVDVTPLGARDAWLTPVLFLGRTGMHMAIRWQLEGWFG